MLLRLFLSLLTLVTALSCSLPNPHWGARSQTTIRLPQPPAGWEAFGPFPYRLVTYGADWECATTQIEAGDELSVVAIEKGTPTPVLAFPVIGGRTDLLKPAGGVYPLTLDEHGTLTVSYRDGPLASLLIPVVQNAALAKSLNIARLQAEIWERSQGDPWAIDREAILETLLYGVMRSDRIKLLPHFSLEALLAPGSWVWANPFTEPVEVAGDESRKVGIELAVGVHHLFHVEATGIRRIDVEIDETGWILMDELKGSGESGNW